MNEVRFVDAVAVAVTRYMSHISTRLFGDELADEIARLIRLSRYVAKGRPLTEDHLCEIFVLFGLIRPTDCGAGVVRLFLSGQWVPATASVRH